MRHGLIKTAGPLNERDLNTLKSRLNRLFGEEIDYSVEEDPSLIGGFTAYVDGKLYDMSILTKLSEMQKRIAEPARQDREVIEAMTDEERRQYALSVGEHFNQRLSQMEPGARVYDYGTVLSCADGIVHVDGLRHSKYGELLQFENDAFGMAIELSSKGIGAVLFSGADEVYAGSIARGTGKIIDIGVGHETLGRVLDPLGRPLDGKPIEVKKHRPIECPAPGIMDRVSVNQPMETGILAIDSMIPIGKGQRELIIGDRQMGKSVIALSTIINQSKQGVICIYCAIGQKASTVVQVINTLKKRADFNQCIVISSTASDSPAMQYIAPYAACSIGEYFMYKGRDVLVVYDDLSKHATSYRTMSLLLKRPPGREAYPGDVFYLHSRLLERAAKLSDLKGGGSMTALPIVETMAGDISAYIPTNVISITDGQIYLESELFHAGVRPAVNVGLSVSRVGRAAQAPAMRAVSGQLRLKLAQFRELAVFSQFDSDLDATTQKMLDSGNRLTELLKQDQNTVYSLSEQVAILLAYSEGLFDAVPMDDISKTESALCEFLHATDHGTMNAIDRTHELDELYREALTLLIEKFKEKIASEQGVLG